MPKVELIYSEDCPNIAKARVELLRAFSDSKLLPQWNEWQVEDSECPAELRGYGSPTVLVDRLDVAPAATPDAPRSCRLYAAADGSMSTVPPSAAIAFALLASGDVVARRPAWRRGLSMVPAIGVALLPKVACPACWPAYAGVLSAIGLGFLINETYLLAATVVFVSVALFGLAFRARARHGFGPLGIGVAAAVVLLVGKFHFENDAAMYAALVGLAGASLWNTWPSKPSTSGPTCPSCVPPLS